MTDPLPADVIELSDHVRRWIAQMPEDVTLAFRLRDAFAASAGAVISVLMQGGVGRHDAFKALRDMLDQAERAGMN